jgi:hypothetical protein
MQSFWFCVKVVLAVMVGVPVVALTGWTIYQLFDAAL